MRGKIGKQRVNNGHQGKIFLRKISENPHVSSNVPLLTETTFSLRGKQNTGKRFENP
jgi:hypothetical protein